VTANATRVKKENSVFGRKKRVERAITTLHLIVLDHKDVLLTQRLTLYSPDRFGIRNPAKWLKELTYFKKEVIDIRLTGLDKALLEGFWKKKYFDELDAIIAYHAG
jgi:hypothetical protein